MSAQEKIRHQVTANSVVLYMKGTPQSPQCGFSGATVQILKACGVQDFTAVDVLADPEIRDGIKAYSNWPTIPQLSTSRASLSVVPILCARCISKVNCRNCSIQRRVDDIETGYGRGTHSMGLSYLRCQ